LSVDPNLESGLDPLDFLLIAGRLAEVDVLAGHRVYAGVDPDVERAAPTSD
jgi:hypothetical protein